jgi:hypothetical protein
MRGGAVGTDVLDLDDSTAALGDPFATPAASGQLFLNQAASGEGSTSACVDSGNAGLAPEGYRRRTTRSDLARDEGAVDRGAHYADAAPVIYSVEVTETELAWDGVNIAACRIFDDVTSSFIAVPADALDEGGVAHGRDPGDTLYLICTGDGAPAVVRVTVP